MDWVLIAAKEESNKTVIHARRALDTRDPRDIALRRGQLVWLLWAWGVDDGWATAAAGGPPFAQHRARGSAQIKFFPATGEVLRSTSSVKPSLAIDSLLVAVHAVAMVVAWTVAAPAPLLLRRLGAPLL